MSTPTDENRDLVTVIAQMRATPGREDDLRSALEGLVRRTTREEGCVNYDLYESTEEPGRFFFYENWETGEALDAHLVSGHIREFGSRVDELVDQDGVTVHRVRRIA